MLLFFTIFPVANTCVRYSRQTSDKCTFAVCFALKRCDSTFASDNISIRDFEVWLNPIELSHVVDPISAHRTDRPTSVFSQCKTHLLPVVAVPLQLALFLGIILRTQFAFATAFVVKFRLRQPPLCGWTEAGALRVCTPPFFTRMNRGTHCSLRAAWRDG
jgi:hypothetical protein